MIKWFIISVLVVLLPAAAGDEAALKKYVYINDVYRYVLPIPDGTVACTSPEFSDLHGFILLLEPRKCRDNKSLASLDISAFWNPSNSAKAQNVGINFCEGGQSDVSHVNFGDVALKQCKMQPGEKTIRFYGVRSIPQSHGPVSIIYFIEARNMSGSEIEIERRLNSIFNGVRFLTR